MYLISLRYQIALERSKDDGRASVRTLAIGHGGIRCWLFVFFTSGNRKKVAIPIINEMA